MGPGRDRTRDPWIAVRHASVARYGTDCATRPGWWWWCLLWDCHFPTGILGQVWYLIVWIPDLCTLTYFYRPDSIKNGEFSRTKGNNFWRHCTIWTIIELEEDIMVLNNMTKFHKLLDLQSRRCWCVKGQHLMPQPLWWQGNKNKGLRSVCIYS